MLARALSRIGALAVAKGVEARRPFLRVLNYHGTPARYRDNLARQFDALLARYRGASGSELETVLRDGATKPTVMFSFDDGLRNNLTVAAPLLEERGVRGIFSVTAAFPSIARDAQPRWFLERVRPERNAEHLEDDDLLSMSWSDVRELHARGHRICSHSFNHLQIDSRTPLTSVEHELRDSRKELERQLGDASVDGFCWPVDFDQAAPSADAIARETYRYALCTGTAPMFAGHDPFRVYRTNIEASWPLEVLDLQLSGLIDAKYAASRLRRRARAVLR